MRTVYSTRKAALLASTMILPVQAGLAQDGDESFSLEEIVVTAEKRAENLQNVAISVQVLGNEQMENLNVNGFEDYVKFLPTVNFTNARPGVGQIYMRGIVSGSNGNHSASMPSVGVYLDEQPITTINEILDLHMYDMARVETLAGPQGTLYGASSQAGTLKIVTNKPVLGEFQAGYDVAIDKVKNGEFGYTLEGFANIPIADNAAIRLVGWQEEDGGYIDNVPGTLDFLGTGVTLDNNDLVEDDFNDVRTSGARGLLKVDLNDNWTVNAGLIYNDMKSTGLFDHDPKDVGDLQVSTFSNSEYDENWLQASLTVEGNIGGWDLVYAGAYLDRDRISEYDYTGFTQYYINLYNYYGSDLCWYYNSEGGCADPYQYTTGDETFNRNSHEFRISSPQDNRLRFIGGLFYQKAKHDFDLRWIVPDAAKDGAFGDVVPEDPETVVWQTYQVREDREEAIFGEIYFDLTDDLTLTAGFRKFWYNNTLYGFNGFLPHCTGFYDDNGNFVQDRENGTPQYPCFDTRVLDGVSKGNGELFKFNVEYNVSDDAMVYATYSEGYRPGGVNRARVPGIPGYDPDWVTNYEVGWKSQWLDNRLRFNGSIYRIEWDDIQLAFLDFEVSILTIIQNAGKSKTQGIEFDLDYAASENLTLSLSGSYNDATLSEDYLRTAGDPTSLIAPKGTRMPFVPKLQLFASARYTQEVADYPAFFQASASYTGGSWSALDTRVETQAHDVDGVWTTRQVGRRGWQDDYITVNLSAGIDAESWSLGLFIDNAFDARPTITNGDFTYTAYYSEVDTRNQTIRPRTIGLRFGQRF